MFSFEYIRKTVWKLQTETTKHNCNIYLFKVPQHGELLLFGNFALVQSRLDSGAEVHQAAVALVLVRFDFADVDLSAGAIITVLHQRSNNYQQAGTLSHSLCMQ